MKQDISITLLQVGFHTYIVCQAEAPYQGLFYTDKGFKAALDFVRQSVSDCVLTIQRSCKPTQIVRYSKGRKVRSVQS